MYNTFSSCLIPIQYIFREWFLDRFITGVPNFVRDRDKLAALQKKLKSF